LYSSDFGKDLLLYIFASNPSLAVVLKQKNDEGKKQPLSFMSVGLQGFELNYLTIDKQAYEKYKTVKDFRPYLLKSHLIIFVPHPWLDHFLNNKSWVRGV